MQALPGWHLQASHASLSPEHIPSSCHLLGVGTHALQAMVNMGQVLSVWTEWVGSLETLPHC